MEALVGINPSITTRPQLLQRRRRLRRSFRILAVARAIRAVELSGGGGGGGPELVVEQAGGKRVVELVGAFNELTETMKKAHHSSQTQTLLFKSLKLSIPILHSLPLSPDGRSPLSKALSLALLLAHLQMDAEVISAGILRQVLEAGAVSILEVRDRIGTGTT